MFGSVHFSAKSNLSSRKIPRFARNDNQAICHLEPFGCARKRGPGELDELFSNLR